MPLKSVLGGVANTVAARGKSVPSTTRSAPSRWLASDEFIVEQLDRTASFGDVFGCSMLEAREAVEGALNQLGLLHLARRYW